MATRPAQLRHFIGLMSGTSIDGVDGVLVSFDPDGRPDETLAFLSLPIDPDLRERLNQLQQPGPNDLEMAAVAGLDLARLYARAVTALLEMAGIGANDVCAIGAHGQTVRHRPEAGYTLQLLAPALLAELTGIDVVADLRSADIAAGGEGAPLVPAFHRVAFGQPGQSRGVVNIGGIANISVLDAQGGVSGHDTGPGNTLIDAWCRRHLGLPYDDGGRWAASGRVDPDLLARWLAEPYFQRRPPKSTGRDLFHLDWAIRLGGERLTGLAPVDVQATLVELTAVTIAADIGRTPASAVYICGGGACNATLMARLGALLSARLPATTLAVTDALGMPPQAVEATAFAWLARQRIDRLPGSLASVTGARGDRVLGAVYPGKRDGY